MQFYMVLGEKSLKDQVVNLLARSTVANAQWFDILIILQYNFSLILDVNIQSLFTI